MSKQTVRKSKKLLSPKAGALSDMSLKQHVTSLSADTEAIRTRCIRTELLAHRQELPILNVKTLLSIEKLTVHLESKGKARTRKSNKKEL